MPVSAEDVVHGGKWKPVNKVDVCGDQSYEIVTLQE